MRLINGIGITFYHLYPLWLLEDTHICQILVKSISLSLHMSLKLLIHNCRFSLWQFILHQNDTSQIQYCMNISFTIKLFGRQISWYCNILHDDFDDLTLNRIRYSKSFAVLKYIYQSLSSYFDMKYRFYSA